MRARAWAAVVTLAVGSVLLGTLAPSPAAVAVPAPPRPAVDDQAVVIEVPGTPTDPGTTAPCPALTRADFVYSFVDDRRPAGTEVVDSWTAPVRLGLRHPPVSVTVTLRPGVALPAGRLCQYAFTFASFATGAGGAGGRTLVGGPVTGVVDASTPSVTLAVAPPVCTGQVDLWAGTERFDDGAVPAAVSIATWSGDRGCTGGGVLADLVVVPVPACPGAPLSWLVVNANGRAVQAQVTLEGGPAPVDSALLAEPGVTPVQLNATGTSPAALTITWTDDAGTERRLREPAAPGLQPGTPVHDRRCSGGDPGFLLDKTADPPEGDPVAAGDAVTWTVTVRNTGTTPLTDLEVLDVVPAYASVTDAGSGAVAADARLVRWRVSLAAGERLDLSWRGEVTATAPVGLDLVNTAVVAAFGAHDTTRHPITGATTPATTPGTPATTPGTPGVTSPGGTGPTAPAAGPPGPGGPLARTGAALLALLLAAGAALLVGGLLVRASRRGPGTARVGTRAL